MPQDHTDRFHANHARDKREEELRDYSEESLRSVYNIAVGRVPTGDADNPPREDMVAAVLATEFGALD